MLEFIANQSIDLYDFCRLFLPDSERTLIAKDIYENLNLNNNPIIVKAEELFTSGYHVNAISARDRHEGYWKVSYTIAKTSELPWKEDYIILRRSRECIEKLMQEAAIIGEAVELVIFDKHAVSLDDMLLKPCKWWKFSDEFDLYSFLHKHLKPQPRVYKVVL